MLQFFDDRQYCTIEVKFARPRYNRLYNCCGNGIAFSPLAPVTQQLKQLGGVSDFLYKRKGHRRRKTKRLDRKRRREKTPGKRLRENNKEQAVILRRRIETTNQGLIRTEHMTKTKTTRPRTNHT